MKKIVIKCDKCKKIIDGENGDSQYFTFAHQTVEGFAFYMKPHPFGVTPEHHICEPCFTEHLGLEI